MKELKKIEKVKDKSQCIGEFLEWLFENRYFIACYAPDGTELITVHKSTDKWLADYFQIDLNKVEKEKRAILDCLRRRV